MSNRFNSPAVKEAVEKAIVYVASRYGWEVNTDMLVPDLAQAAITAMLEMAQMNEDTASNKAGDHFKTNAATWGFHGSEWEVFEMGYIKALCDLGLITEDTTVKE